MPMDVTTLRLPESLKDNLAEEAKEMEMSTTEYIRHVLRQRNTQQEHAEEYDKRIRKLEQRVEQVERSATASTEKPQEGAQSDLIEYVRENQPVSKSDILEECVPSDYPGKPSSWWDVHGQDALKEAGFEFTRNVGWHD